MASVPGDSASDDDLKQSRIKRNPTLKAVTPLRNFVSNAHCRLTISAHEGVHPKQTYGSSGISGNRTTSFLTSKDMGGESTNKQRRFTKTDLEDENEYYIATPAPYFGAEGTKPPQKVACDRFDRDSPPEIKDLRNLQDLVRQKSDGTIDFCVIEQLGYVTT